MTEAPLHIQTPIQNFIQQQYGHEKCP